jgi:hypothetical protein
VQSDQNGLNFAQRMIVFFGDFVKIAEVAHNWGLLFSTVKVMNEF